MLHGSQLKRCIPTKDSINEISRFNTVRSGGRVVRLLLALTDNFRRWLSRYSTSCAILNGYLRSLLFQAELLKDTVPSHRTRAGLERTPKRKRHEPSSWLYRLSIVVRDLEKGNNPGEGIIGYGPYGSVVVPKGVGVAEDHVWVMNGLAG